MFHYMGGSGNIVDLSRYTFMSLIDELNMHGKIDVRNGVPVPGAKGLYSLNVSAYVNAQYAAAVGGATLYFTKDGMVGYSDYWNFEAKPAGQRNPWAEAATTFGRFVGDDLANGKAFWVIYGITPPLSQIPNLVFYINQVLYLLVYL